MKKLFRVLTLLLLISFISPYGYSSEIVRVKNIKSDKEIYRPNITEILELIEEGDEEYWYGIYYADEKLGWLQILVKVYESENFNQKIVEFILNMNFTIKMIGGIKSALFAREGLFLSKLTGPGKIILQSMPFEHLAQQVIAKSGILDALKK